LAVPHAEDIAYISHNEVIKLFKDAAKALERVRASAVGSTEEALQVKALQTYGEQSVGLRDVKDRLLNRKLKDLPKHG
jgi:hypothetical protein